MSDDITKLPEAVHENSWVAPDILEADQQVMPLSQMTVGHSWMDNVDFLSGMRSCAEQASCLGDEIGRMPDALVSLLSGHMDHHKLSPAYRLRKEIPRKAILAVIHHLQGMDGKDAEELAASLLGFLEFPVAVGILKSMSENSIYWNWGDFRQNPVGYRMSGFLVVSIRQIFGDRSHLFTSRPSNLILMNWLLACCGDMVAVRFLCCALKGDLDTIRAMTTPLDTSHLVAKLEDILGMWLQLSRIAVHPREHIAGADGMAATCLALVHAQPMNESPCNLRMLFICEETSKAITVDVSFPDHVPGLDSDVGESVALYVQRRVSVICAKEVPKDFISLKEGVRAFRGCGGDEAWTGQVSRFPWTMSANLRLAQFAEVARRGEGGIFTMPPLLLVGPPGMGKSRWGRHAAEVMGVPFYGVSFSGTNNAVIVTGMEKGWATAHPGLAARAMRDTDCANPLVLVDEVDKAATSDRNGNAVEALLPLLERETAERFPDACLLAPVDASGITWVLTANSIDNVSRALLNRVTVVHVDVPDACHIPSIISAMRLDLAHQWRILPDNLPDVERADVDAMLRDYASGHSLRTLKRKLSTLMLERMWQPPAIRLH